MYWQKYFQLYYSNDTVRWKEAKINVKGTDPLTGFFAESQNVISDWTKKKMQESQYKIHKQRLRSTVKASTKEASYLQENVSVTSLKII